MNRVSCLPYADATNAQLQHVCLWVIGAGSVIDQQAWNLRRLQPGSEQVVHLLQFV
jgi:hypothetical protein